MKNFIVTSKLDNVPLSGAIMEPEGEPKAVIQLTHGMCEHKERYYDFMRYLAANGYVAAIHDHRGHGMSLAYPNAYGYFNEQPYDALAQDLFQISLYLKTKYPNSKLYLFGHSMGTLACRLYLKNHDNLIDRLVLSGPPTNNPVIGAAVAATTILKKKEGPQARVESLNNLVFGAYNKGYDVPNAWLSVNEDNVKAYNEDPLCGFVFTLDAYDALFHMLKEVFSKKGWHVTNKQLPILLAAGLEDPMIQSKRSFMGLKSFLVERGYTKVEGRLYSGMRHEILNEKNNQKVYEDILEFFDRE
ncbi:MAG: alpha/beta hydrolase [Lachnospiraceae bacterium]|nr:alpha/beta hydrolase [Lachnospiraceae bacterium]